MKCEPPDKVNTLTTVRKKMKAVRNREERTTRCLKKKHKKRWKEWSKVKIRRKMNWRTER